MLWVTEEAPDHSGGGGSIRQAYLLDALSTAFSVDVLVAGEVGDDRIRSTAASVTEVGADQRLWTEHPIGRRMLRAGDQPGVALPAARVPVGPPPCGASA